MAPVTLAVLVDEAHFWLGQELRQLLVRGCGGPGAWGRWDAHSWGWEEGSMDGVLAQYMQLHSCDDMLEVVLGGCTGVEAAITKLQGAKQQALFRAQEAVVCTHLWGQGLGLRGCRTTLLPRPAPRSDHLWGHPMQGHPCGISIYQEKQVSI